MKITIKGLTLLNFKGVRSLSIKFGSVTNISGDNATGKTTVFDAFLWLFFGKDSSDRKDFEIKTLDQDNKAYPKIPHEVSAVIIVDGKEITIRRVYLENWTTKRGERQEKMTGHVQEFYWNDVPLKLEEYQAKVAGILPESLFKLITNAAYFNSMKWQDRRSELLKLAGNISADDIQRKLEDKITIANKHLWGQLFNALNAGKSPDEYLKVLSAKKKKIKDDLVTLPTRIDEAHRNLPEEQDYSQINADIAGFGRDLEKIERLLLDESNAANDHSQKILAYQREIYTHQEARQRIEFDIRSVSKDHHLAREQRIATMKREIRELLQDQVGMVTERDQLTERKRVIEADQKRLRSNWTAVNNKQLEFKDSEFCCPACNRAFETSDIEKKKEELTKNFNADKSRQLNEITRQGQQLGQSLKQITERLEEIAKSDTELAETIKTAREVLAAFESSHVKASDQADTEIARQLEANADYKAHGAAIAVLEAEIRQPYSADNTKEKLLQEKRDLDRKLTELRQLLSTQDLRQKGLDRIAELSRQESELGSALADLEGAEFVVAQYERAKMDLLEERVNSRFSLVRFKLFQEQINGGEAPCCETLVGGVPYADLNTASRINAGLDILNTLCAHYNAYAPVFIDNAESINTLLPVKSQLIRLVVSKDKKLKIDAPKAELFDEVTA